MPLNKKYFIAHVGLDSNNQINCMVHNDNGCINDLLIKKSLCTTYSEKLRPIIGQDTKWTFFVWKFTDFSVLKNFWILCKKPIPQAKSHWWISLSNCPVLTKLKKWKFKVQNLQMIKLILFCRSKSIRKVWSKLVNFVSVYGHLKVSLYISFFDKNLSINLV